MLAAAALMASLADETPEGRSIVELAKSELRPVEADFADRTPSRRAVQRQTRMSGLDIGERQLAQGRGRRHPASSSA